ncbi:MAG TPA: hypothetical protein VHD76_15070 [Bryobacteraceae bacterium]|jgi:hypothetical protein|nr:hypothetical protein [Bryobacteraceae bacterium]
MFGLLVSFLLAAGQSQTPDPVQAAIQEIAASGVVVELALPPGERVNPERQIAPGAPPLLAFRYLEGNQHHRFNQLNLVIDDAGH